MIRTLALVILFGAALALPLAAAEQGALPSFGILVDDARLEALPGTPAARRMARAADDAIKARDAGKLEGVLARASSQDPLLYEWLVVTVLQKLRVAAPMPKLEALLATLAAAPARIYRQHPETAAAYYIPVFEPDRMAAGTLEVWHREKLAREWIARMASDPLALVAAAKTPDASPALVRAIELADAAALARLVAVLPPGGFRAAPGFWSMLARQTHDPAMFALAFRHEGDPEALALLQRMPASLAPRDAMAQLELLLDHGSLASAALSTLVALSPDDAETSRRLLELMADEELGATAASALARKRGAKLVDAAAAQLAQSKGATEQRNLLLYLRLVGTPSALASAKSAAGLPNLDPALREELATW